MKPFSSILSFTNRFGFRGVTYMTNGAQGGGGGKSVKKIPSQSAFLKPILRVLQGMGGLGEKSEVVSRIIGEMGFSDEQIGQTIKSGHPLIAHRIAFARETLATTGYISRDGKRGWWKLTTKGLRVDWNNLDLKAINKESARLYQESARLPQKKQIVSAAGDSESDELPNQSEEERIAVELLQHLKQSVSWHGFEVLCQQLLISVGFIEVVLTETKPYKGDGGFDGIGKLKASPANPFVTTSIAFECKRYDSNLVDVKVVRNLQAKVGVHNVAEKGVIVTTSNFTQAARKEAKKGNVSIELINGEKLAQLMVDNHIGVRTIPSGGNGEEKKSLEVDKEFFRKYKK